VLERQREAGEVYLPYVLAAHITYEVCKALDYAHRKRDNEGNPPHIVHRDISHSNIFISFEGAVKVGAFGLAKARDNLERTEAGIIKGKYNYLSPKQVQSAAVDHRSDIFSLGTTLYEMTCGVRPFATDTESKSIAPWLPRLFFVREEFLPSTIYRRLQSDGWIIFGQRLILLLVIDFLGRRLKPCQRE